MFDYEFKLSDHMSDVAVLERCTYPNYRIYKYIPTGTISSEIYNGAGLIKFIKSERQKSIMSVRKLKRE